MKMVSEEGMHKVEASHGVCKTTSLDHNNLRYRFPTPVLQSTEKASKRIKFHMEFPT